MALTVAVDSANVNVVGNKRNVPVTLTADDDYPAEGWPISASDCGLVVLERMIFETGFEDDPDAPTENYPASFNKVSSAVQAWVNTTDAPADAGLVELADVDLIDGFVARAIAVGY